MASWHRLLAAAVVAAGLADREALGFAPNGVRAVVGVQQHRTGHRSNRRVCGNGAAFVGTDGRCGDNASSPSSTPSSSSSSATRLHLSLVDTLLSLDFGTLSDTLDGVATSAHHFLEPAVGIEHELSARSATFLGHHPELWRDVNFVANSARHAWEAYGNALRDHPLATKSATATTLAVAGDAVAQFSAMSAPSPNGGTSSGGRYDLRRAVSLGLFAALYTGAFQHFWFGWLNSHLAYEASLLSPTMAVLLASPLSPGVTAALKVGVNQFGMVPLVYMPMFFALTGAVGGLSAGESWERARGLFVPLIVRNWAFWLPAQLVQFALIPPEFQITYLCTAGLFWNIILSAASSGNAAPAASDQAGARQAADDDALLPDAAYAYAEDAVTLSDVGEVLSDVGDVLVDSAGEVAGALAAAAEDALAETKHVLSDAAAAGGEQQAFAGARSSPIEGSSGTAVLDDKTGTDVALVEIS